MNCRRLSDPKGFRASAWSLVELLIAMAVAGLVLTVVAKTTLFAARSFVAIGNYDELSRTSQNALDTMSKQIRQAKRVVAFQTNRIELEDQDGLTLVFHWDPSSGLLTRQKSGVTSVLLTDCDYLLFGRSQRNPSNNFTFWTTSDNNQIKLIDVSWRCSRQILQQKVNTESVQTAKIVLRN
jgi:type II secretory pathway pseudopilin PulG